MVEEWRVIPNTNNIYYISNLGNLKTLNWKNSKQERIMLPAKDNNGYLRTAIIIKGKLTTIKLHRLVAEAFIPNPKNKSQVNHKNFNRCDNRVENLEWCTPLENYIHSFNFNRMKIPNPINTIIKRGELNGCSKLTDKQVLEIRQKFKPRIYTREMLAKEYGVKASTIKDIVLRKSWRHLK